MDPYVEMLEEVSAVSELASGVVGLFMSLVTYVLTGLALYRMAKRLGVDSPWLSYVPIANLWMLGKVADAGEAKPKHAKRLMITYLLMIIPLSGMIGSALGALLAGSPESLPTTALVALLGSSALAIVLAIVHTVFWYIAYYRICENFAPENKTGYFLGMLLGGMCCSTLIPPILMLILSGKEPQSNKTVTCAAETL